MLLKPGMETTYRIELLVRTLGTWVIWSQCANLVMMLPQKDCYMLFGGILVHNRKSGGKIVKWKTIRNQDCRLEKGVKQC